MAPPPKPKFSNSNLIDVGLLPGINEWNDPSGAFSAYKKNLMRVIDIIPVYFTLDAVDLFQPGITIYPIDLNFLQGIIEFQAKLASISITDRYQGIRAWVTNETTSQDELQNIYKENKISDTVNTQLDNINKSDLFEYLKSTGGLRSNISSGTIKNPLAAALIDGRHLSLPRIWEKSDYNPSLSLGIKLNSPYGNPSSFLYNIAKPLLATMALVSPSSYDGISYGVPPYMLVRAYGISYMTLAQADSLSIVRGGGDARVNALKQPLEITINMSFKPALPGFAAMLIGDIAPIGKVLVSVGDEDVPDSLSKKIPGITSLGSIIESLRPVESSASAKPLTLDIFGVPDNVPTAQQSNESALYRSSSSSSIIENTAQQLFNAGIGSSTDQIISLLNTI